MFRAMAPTRCDDVDADYEFRDRWSSSDIHSQQRRAIEGKRAHDGWFAQLLMGS